MVLLKDIIQEIQNFAPFTYQESYDNSGLITGNGEMDIRGAVLCLDVTEQILEEALRLNYNLIIAHHPILFQGVKKLTGANYVERILIKAIKNDIAILAVHTNLDNVKWGVNQKMADKLGLVNTQVLLPLPQILKQIYTYVPSTHSDAVCEALCQAGAGKIGAYENCSFQVEGKGSFKALDGANPFIGNKGELHQEKEVKLELIFPKHVESAVVNALRGSHPYEEIAYGIIDLQNTHAQMGAGLIGELPEAMMDKDFLHYLKKAMNTAMVRHTRLFQKNIKKVALCGGSGSFLLHDAMQKNADIFITGDYKYHQFFDADNQIVIADIGHYESEQFTPEIFYDLLSKKFPTFALQITSVNTNPIQYL